MCLLEMGVFEVGAWAIKSLMSCLTLPLKKLIVRSLHYSWKERGIWNETKFKTHWPWKPGVIVASAIKHGKHHQLLGLPVHFIIHIPSVFRESIRGSLGPWRMSKSSLQHNSLKEQNDSLIKKPPEENTWTLLKELLIAEHCHGLLYGHLYKQEWSWAKTEKAKGTKNVFLEQKTVQQKRGWTAAVSLLVNFPSEGNARRE